MQLTKQTDFAFRVLIYLASSDETTRSQIYQIAERYGISKSHVMKIVQKLSHHGYISAKRGLNGGITLGKSSKKISLKEVVLLMEQTLDPVNCKESGCILTGNCLLKSHLLSAQEQYLSYLNNVYLYDVVTSSTKEILFKPEFVELS